MIPNDVLIERRNEATGAFSLIDEMFVEPGTKADWDQLHDLHYKAETLPAGPRFWRCVTSSGDLVGVTVLSSVSLLLGPRHEVFPKLKPGNDNKFTNVHRGKWLNANMRRAARIVTDTLYRGVGVSYRMVNLSMRMQGIRFVEIQSSMSKFNPFDTKAGFRHAHLKKAAAYEQGFSFFRRFFEAHPADHDAIMKEFDSMPAALRVGVRGEMLKFYYRHSPKEKTGKKLGKTVDDLAGIPTPKLIKEMQQLIFATPVYGIWENPDLGRKLPQRLPLRAFDLQSPNEPLRLDLL